MADWQHSVSTKTTNKQARVVSVGLASGLFSLATAHVARSAAQWSFKPRGAPPNTPGIVSRRMGHRSRGRAKAHLKRTSLAKALRRWRCKGCWLLWSRGLAFNFEFGNQIVGLSQIAASARCKLRGTRKQADTAICAGLRSWRSSLTGNSLMFRNRIRWKASSLASRRD
jgi:hypothetical protein